MGKLQLGGLKASVLFMNLSVSFIALRHNLGGGEGEYKVNKGNTKLTKGLINSKRE